MRLLFAPLLFVAGVAGAADAIPLPPDAPILSNGTVTVTARDFEAVLSRVPEQFRFETRASPEKVTTMVDEVYLNRALAQEAIAAGLDKDPVVQQRLKQLHEAYLASLVNREMEKKALARDLEKRAREIYNADLAKFQEPEAVRIVIATIEFECRTPTETEVMARNIVERGRMGDDVKALTDMFRESRDPGRRGSGETVATRQQLEPEVAAWAFDKLKIGQVSDPIAVKGGYAIVKLIDKRAARTTPFESVKAKLIEDERIKVVKATLDARVREIQTDPKLQLNRENLLALRTEIDTAKLKRIQEEALRKSRTGK